MGVTAVYRSLANMRFQRNEFAPPVSVEATGIDATVIEATGIEADR